MIMYMIYVYLMINTMRTKLDLSITYDYIFTNVLHIYIYICTSKSVRIFCVFKSQIAPVCLTSSSGLWMYLQVVPMTQLRASVENHPLEGPMCHFHDGRKGNN